MTASFQHISVLLNESIEGLAIKPDGIYIDGTFGRGGHSRTILAQLGPEGRLYSIDRDPQAIAEAQKIDDPRFTIVHGPFSGIAEHSVMIWWVKSMVCCSISAFLHRSWMMPSAVLVL